VFLSHHGGASIAWLAGIELSAITFAAMAFKDQIRKAVVGKLLDGSFHGASELGRGVARVRGELRGVERLRNIPYLETGSSDHLLDVYRSESNVGMRPVVLYIHGGGFRILSKDTHWVFGNRFAKRGYVVFSINYRLAPKHPFPAAVEDACAAWQWVVANAARFGGDPNRIILAGESAGGNLVTGLTWACSTRREEHYASGVFDTGVSPIATIPYCGLLQASDIGRFWRRRDDIPPVIVDRMQAVSGGYLGAMADEVGANPFADPLLFFEGDEKTEREIPPFFMSVGTADPVLDDTRRMSAALARRNVQCETLYSPGELHAYQALGWRPESKLSWRRTFQFLDDVQATPEAVEPEAVEDDTI